MCAYQVLLGDMGVWNALFLGKDVVKVYHVHAVPCLLLSYYLLQNSRVAIMLLSCLVYTIFSPAFFGWCESYIFGPHCSRQS